MYYSSKFHDGAVGVIYDLLVPPAPLNQPFWYICNHSEPNPRINLTISLDWLKIFCAVNISAFGSWILWNITGNINKKAIVMMIPNIMYLMLIHAFLIFSVSHHENTNWKIADQNAKIAQPKMIRTSIPSARSRAHSNQVASIMMSICKVLNEKDRISLLDF